MATTADALMRSRYTAYVLGDARHLLATWHPETRPDDCSPDAHTRWLGLEVKAHHHLDEAHAKVHFVARYREGGKGHRLEEVSEFELRGDQWFYISGAQP